MTFTPVIPASYQTDRQDLNDAMEAIINAFIVSESYAIGRKYASELPDLVTAEGPLIILGDITEAIEHTIQLRITKFTGSLQYLDWITARGEYNTRVNRFADHMRDLFTYNARTVNPDAELYQTGFTEGTLVVGNMTFGVPQVDFTYDIQEGYR